MRWLEERLREVNGELGNGDQWDMSWIEIDPNDPNMPMWAITAAAQRLPATGRSRSTWLI